MKMRHIHDFHPNQKVKSFRDFTTALILLSAAVFYTSNSAIAGGWDDNYHECAETHITDVSDLTISQGAIALELNTLVTVLPAEIVDLLDSSENITVFAPTDDAFGKIPVNVLTEIASDPDVLTSVLSYHVVPNKVDPRKAHYTKKIGSLAEQNLFISRDEMGPTVNNSKIDCQGYRTANGLVWVIDSVLMPQFK